MNLIQTIIYSDIHPSNWSAALDALEAFGGYKTWDDSEHAFHILTTASDSDVELASRMIERILS